MRTRTSAIHTQRVTHARLLEQTHSETQRTCTRAPGNGFAVFTLEALEATRALSIVIAFARAGFQVLGFGVVCARERDRNCIVRSKDSGAKVFTYTKPTLKKHARVGS